MNRRDQPQLEPAVQTLLHSLRRRIRRYIWLEGVATALAWLGLAFWISIGLDWVFEPKPAPRMAIFAAATLAFLWIVVALIVRRLVVPLTDRSMALLLERYFPQFRDRLITAVELIERGAGGNECDPAMLRRTAHDAAAPVPDVRLRRVFNPGPLRRSVVAAVILVLSIVVFALASSRSMEVWAKRSLLFDRELLWPRNTELVMGEPFGESMSIKVARGSDVEVFVKARLDKPVVPQTVEIRSRTEGGARERRMMNREGAADPDKDEFQDYSHSFRGVLAPLSFDVFGGDDALRNRRIEVVESPQIVRTQLECEFPKYIGRNPYTVAATGLMQFPLGTRVTVRARANKDLVRVTVDSALEEPVQPPQTVLPDADDPRSFQFTYERLSKDKTFLFTLLDTDQIKSREPMRLTLAALEDQRPEFAVQLRGIGSAITPSANIPAGGRVTDDYGIGKVWFEFSADEGQPTEQPIASPAGNPTELEIDAALDVRDLNLKPGQKFHLTIKGADRYDLTGRPNVGGSDRWLLEVVTPDRLRTMLQARELGLRQRFETIVQEMVDTRESLARIDFGTSPSTKPTPTTAAEPGGAVAEPSGARAEPSGARAPGDTAGGEDPSPERSLAQRVLRVQWAMQNSHKDAQETLGVAAAFGDIRAELINNRIDTAELKERLEGRIADPLRRIGGEMFPELDRRLDRLQEDLSNSQSGEEGRNRAIAQVDAVVLAMRQVLASMLELEDFNEAVEMLRSIIKSHRKIIEQTKQRHGEGLGDLIE